MLSSSADYILMGPQTSLVYMLADAGFDVWMGNSRGNRYSNRHRSRNNQTQVFWDFSWHEVGSIDVPNVIDYILARTGQQRLQYVGHSQGTTVFWVMMSQHPYYNQRVKSAHLLAPAAYMHRTRSPYVIFLAAYLHTTELMLQMMGTYYFAPTNEMDIQGGIDKCRDGAPFQQMCTITTFLMAGFNSQEVNYVSSVSLRYQLTDILTVVFPADNAPGHARSFTGRSVSHADDPPCADGPIADLPPVRFWPDAEHDPVWIIDPAQLQSE